MTPPKRRFALTLEGGGDTRQDIANMLRNIAFDIETDDRDEREVTSGGYATGYHFRLDCDPEMDHDKFNAALEEWLESHRKERA